MGASFAPTFARSKGISLLSLRPFFGNELLCSTIVLEGDGTPIIRSIHSRGPSGHSVWLAKDNGLVESYSSHSGESYTHTVTLRSVQPEINSFDFVTCLSHDP